MATVTSVASNLSGSLQFDGATVLTGMSYKNPVVGYSVVQPLSEFQVKKGDWVVPIGATYLALTNSQYKIFLDAIVNHLPIEEFTIPTLDPGSFTATSGMLYDPAKGCHVVTAENGTYKATPGAHVLFINNRYRQQQQDMLQEFLMVLEPAQFNSLFMVPGIILATTLGAGGINYVAFDTGNIAGGIGGTYKALTVNAGAVLTYSILTPGTGYAATPGHATTTGGAQPGIGTGLTINITSVT